MTENLNQKEPSEAGAEATDAQAPVAGKAKAPGAGKAKANGGAEWTAPVFAVRTAGPAGRRRSGIAFGPEPVVVESRSLSPRELDALLNDPQLLVEEL